MKPLYQLAGALTLIPVAAATALAAYLLVLDIKRYRKSLEKQRQERAR